ncbi:MAG: serine hydrolase, partial [Actinobacteria bacterium]|nr:serine hydrolase [Actinomycetota bacterium]
MIHGQVEPGFEAVREEFTRNFTERGEVGAACCVYLDGEKVVDLWGGYRDEKKRLPWEEDTLVLVFSTTKG